MQKPFRRQAAKGHLEISLEDSVVGQFVGRDE
jgi:hypothetical protein